MRRIVVCASVWVIGVSVGCGSGSGGSPDATPDAVPDMPATEPCNHLAPTVVTVGETVTASPPSASCADGLHYYRFVPPTTGVYQIAKSGGANVAFCDEENQFGCICASNINCCEDCTLTFDLASDDPLQVGVAYQIYVAESAVTTDYTFTITGPI